MQNAAKHARSATVVVVELSDDDAALRLEVRDDGDGFDETLGHAGVGPGEHARADRGRRRRRLDPFPTRAGDARERAHPVALSVPVVAA